MNYITEQCRIYALGEGRKIIAEIEFPQTSEGVFTITRTFVDESLRGQGVARELVRLAVAEIQSRGGKAAAECSYAKKILEEKQS